jgi:D-sedoheptulose 7-phosphate isomerase
MSKAGAADDFSRAFYPFLHEEDKQSPELTDGLRFSLLEKVRESDEVRARFFADNADAMLAAALQMAKAFHRGGKLLVCGNGGSATDAQHIAVEFMHPITVGRKALPAICLANDMAMVTAVANDVSFSDIFSRQVIALGREGDILLGLSTSGNSDNIVRACETARRMKLVTIAYVGGDGGKLAAMHADGALDFCLTVPTASIHRIQESHVALYHTTWDMVHTFLEHRSVVEAKD